VSQERRKRNQLGIGQKGKYYECGNGGTFFCKELTNGEFEPLVIPGGSAGTYSNCTEEAKLMANARRDRNDGDSQLHKELNTEKRTSGLGNC
jgi:hypothetical protein